MRDKVLQFESAVCSLLFVLHQKMNGMIRLVFLVYERIEQVTTQHLLFVTRYRSFVGRIQYPRLLSLRNNVVAQPECLGCPAETNGSRKHRLS